MQCHIPLSVVVEFRSSGPEKDDSILEFRFVQIPRENVSTVGTPYIRGCGANLYSRNGALRRRKYGPRKQYKCTVCTKPCSDNAVARRTAAVYTLNQWMFASSIPPRWRTRHSTHFLFRHMVSMLLSFLANMTYEPRGVRSLWAARFRPPGRSSFRSPSDSRSAAPAASASTPLISCSRTVGILILSSSRAESHFKDQTPMTE